MSEQYPTAVSEALRSLEGVKMSEFSKAPLVYRLLWRAGFEVPPPLYAGFWRNFANTAIPFALLWGGLMALVFGVSRGMSLRDIASILVPASISAGALAGLGLALYFRGVAKKNNLPSWEEIRSPHVN